MEAMGREERIFLFVHRGESHHGLSVRSSETIFQDVRHENQKRVVKTKSIQFLTRTIWSLAVQLRPNIIAQRLK